MYLIREILVILIPVLDKSYIRIIYVADVSMMEWITRWLLVLSLMKFSNSLPDEIPIGE